MKKRLYLSICTLVVSLVIVVVGSYALFTSSNMFDNNFIKTANVDISTEIFHGEEKVDKIEISNIDRTDTYSYELVTKNNSDIAIAYRIVCEVTTASSLLESLVITIDGNNIDINNEYKRYATDWYENIKGDFTTNLDIHLLQSFSGVSEEIYFDISIEAVSNNFVVVDNQAQLDKVLNAEYVVLSNNYTGDVNINKDLYLDLNGLEIENINISSDEIKLVELVNGSSNTLNINAVNASIYSHITVNNEINANVSKKSLYYLGDNEEDSNLEINIEGGKIYLDTKALATINVSPSSNDVVLEWSDKTTISKVVVQEDTNQQITIDKLDEVVNLEVKNPDANLETEVILEENTDVAFVSSQTDAECFIVIDGKTYKNKSVTLNDALNSDVDTIYFNNDTILLSETLVINKNLKFIGLGEVILEKEFSSVYTNNSLVDIKGSYEVSFDNITLKDHSESNIGSSAISTTINTEVNLTVTNCTIEGFAKNGITVRGGLLTVVNTIFNYGGKEGSAGNAIQVDYNTFATIEGNTFNGFINYSSLWSTTGILLLRGGYATIDNNTFNNNYSSIVVTTMWDTASSNNSTYTESNNTFNNCDYDFELQQNVDYIVSKDESKSYVENVNGVKVVSYAKATTDVINEAVTSSSEGATIYVLDGIYDVAVYQNDKMVSNLLINKSVYLYAKGEVELITNLPANAANSYQQTVFIKSSDVVLDNFIIHETSHLKDDGSSSANKTIEIMSGNNITITNCTLHTTVAGGFYIGGEDVGSYNISNNTVLGGDLGISITNGAGNASVEKSYVNNNNFSGAIFITGVRFNAWNLLDITNLPEINNNTFGGCLIEEGKDEEKVVSMQFIRVVSINLEALISDDDCAEILSNNDFIIEEGKTITHDTYAITTIFETNPGLPQVEFPLEGVFTGSTYTKYFGYKITE